MPETGVGAAGLGREQVWGSCGPRGTRELRPGVAGGAGHADPPLLTLVHRP